MKPSQLILLLLLGSLFGILFTFFKINSNSNPNSNSFDEFKTDFQQYNEFPFDFPRFRQLQNHSNEIPHVTWPPYVDL